MNYGKIYYNNKEGAMMRSRYFQWVFVIVMLISVMYASSQMFWTQKGIALSTEWDYYENQYLSLEAVADTPSQTIDIAELQGKFGEFENGRIRGSLYKEVMIPKQWVGEPLVLYQSAFKENVKIYIEGQYVTGQGSFTVAGNTSFINDYRALSYFRVKASPMHLLILFDQNEKNMIHSKQIYVMPASDMEKRQFLLTMIEILGIMVCVLEAWRIKNSMSNFIDRRERITLLGLIILRWLTVSTAPFVTMLPVSVELWSKVGYLAHILMGFYMMMLLFDQRAIWENRTNIIMGIYTFILVFNVLILNNMIDMKLVLVLHTLVMTSIYISTFKAWYKADKRQHLFILNLLLLLDVAYLFDLLTPPVHLLLYTIYVVYWYRNQYQYEVEQAEDLIPSYADALQAGMESVENDNRYAALLAYVNVGIVSINENLTLDPGYTDYTKKLLGLSETSTNIPSLLYPNDIERRAYVTEMLTQLFKAKTREEKDVYLELLPKKAFHRNKHLALKYHWSHEHNGLVITINDVSKFALLEKRLASDEAQLEMILEVLRHQDDFLSLEDDYRRFAKILSEQLQGNDEALLDLYHMTLDKLHHYKLQFSRFKLSNLTERLERIEYDLKSLQENPREMGIEGLKDMLSSYDFVALLDAHITTIMPFIMVDKKDEKDWRINKAQFESMQQLIEALPDDEVKKQLIDSISKIRHFDFKKSLVSYNRYIEDFSRSVGKKMHPIRVVGNDVLVSRERYALFSKACLEIIQNAILHGIERPEERLRQGKSEYGQIRVEISSSDTVIHIEVSDDGKGFDIQGLKAMLIERYPDSFENISILSDREVVELFTGEFVLDGIEISNHASGLRMLMQEIQSLKGTLDIRFFKQHGTTLHIQLPNDEVYTT